MQQAAVIAETWLLGKRVTAADRRPTIASVRRSRHSRLAETVLARDLPRLTRLLRSGASANSVDSEGSTALYRAAVHGWEEGVRLLLRSGADPNQESLAEGEGTPLGAAAAWGYESVARDLLRHGADPNQREDRGYSPLQWACQGGHLAMARVLLAAGADPNLARSAGWPPLHMAAHRGALAVAQLLLDHDADVFVRDDSGRTAFDVAESWLETDVEADLRHRANPQPGETVDCVRSCRPDGTELITIRVTSSGGGRQWEMETGHRQIADLIRAR